MSTFGTITSGLTGRTRPDFVPLSYMGESDVYQIPYANDPNLTTVGFKMSATDEKTSAKIIENQLVGITRTHVNVHHFNNTEFVFFDGVIADKSNHPLNELIVSISGVEAFISNVFVGHKVEEFAWSGLSHTESNFLWLSLVEEDVDKVGRQSSRVYRDFETRSTLTPVRPVGPENSVLVATYTSGIGINPIPAQRNPHVRVDEHVNDTTNPHGPKLFQDIFVTSGMNVRERFEWGESTSGTLNLSGNKYDNLTYLNNLTQLGTLICSGVFGNILSGSDAQAFFEGIPGGTTQRMISANVDVTSGLSVSGSIFRDNINTVEGATVDGFNFKTGGPLVSRGCISGNPSLHTHTVHSTSGLTIAINPTYPGATFTKSAGGDIFSPVGRGDTFPWEYNNDLGAFLPTIRFKSLPSESNAGHIYIRRYTPQGFNRLESIDVTYKLDSSFSPIEVSPLDASGAAATVPGVFSLSSSGLRTQTISGFKIVNEIGENLPLDLDFYVLGTSGLSCYLGEIVYRYRIENT